MINTQEIMRQAEANLTADSVVLCVKYEAQNPGGQTEADEAAGAAKEH